MNEKQIEEKCYQISDDDDDEDDDEEEDDMNYYDEDESLLEDQDHINGQECSTESNNIILANNNNNINSNSNNNNTNNNNNNNKNIGNTNNNHSRGPYERAWSTEATRALIHIRGPMESHFSEGRHKRTALWLQCTRQLQKMGYRYNAAKVQKKWHNILITYNKNLNKKYTTGHVNWDFFEDMFKYLKGKRADCYNLMTTATTAAIKTIARTAATTATIANHRDNSYTINNVQPTLTLSQRQQQQQQQLQLQQNSLQLHVEMDTKSNDDYDEEDDSGDLLTNMNESKIEVKQERFEQNVNVDSLAITNVCDGNDGNDHFNNVASRIDTSNNDVLENKPLKITCSETSTTFVSLKYQKNSDTNDGSHHYQHQSQHHHPIHQNENEHEIEIVGEHENWWQEYFTRKLKLERDKIDLQKQMHHELMQFNKMSLVQQEKIERMKIDAINNLTSTLQKLVEIKYKKN